MSFRKRHVFPVEAYALLLKETELLTKLNTPDMVALEANYHTRCLVSLYEVYTNMTGFTKPTIM